MANQFDYMLKGKTVAQPKANIGQATNVNENPFSYMLPTPVKAAALPIYSSPATYSNQPAAPSPGLYNDTNPVIGENLFQINTFPIRQNDNVYLKALKSAGNIGLSIPAAVDEGYRKAMIQASSLLSSGKLSNLPKNTSFVQNVLPKSASAGINKFSQKHPVLGGLAEMGIETIAAPTSFITAKGVGNAFLRKNPIEELGANVVPKTTPNVMESIESTDKARLKRTTGQVFSRGKKAEPILESPTINQASKVDDITKDVFNRYPTGTQFKNSSGRTFTVTGAQGDRIVTTFTDEVDGLAKTALYAPKGMESGIEKGVLKIVNTVDNTTQQAGKIDIPQTEGSLALKPESAPKPSSPDVKRMSFPDTAAKAEITSPEMRKFLKDMDFDYTVKHNADTLAKANEVVSTDSDEALRRVLTEYDGSAEMNTQALLLYKRAMDANNMGVAADIVTQIAGNAKTQGQAIQALSMWGRLTPDGILRTAERTIQKALTPDQVKKLEKTSQRVTRGLREANKEASEQVAKDLEKNVEKILSPKKEILPKDIKPKKTSQQKAEVINLRLDAAAEAARKRLAASKGRVMSGIPVDALADYAVIGATYIAKGVVKFSAWSADMVKEFGDELKPHLQLIWDKSKQSYDDIVKEVGTEGDAEELAERITKALGDPGEREAVQSLVDTLFKIAKEQLPTSEIPKTNNALKFVTDSIINRADHRQVWADARDILVTQFADDADKLAIVEDYLNKGIKRTFPQGQLNKAVGQGLRDMGADVGKIVREHFSVNSQTRKDLASRLIREAGLSGEEANILSKYVNNRMKELTKQKKEQILKQIFGVRPLSPRKDVTAKIIEYSNLGAFQNKKYTDLVAQKLGMPTLDDAVRKDLYQQSQKIQTMVEGREKQVATAKMLDTIAAQIPPTLGEKIATLHTMAQLLNPKTAIRNIVGNLGFAGLENVSDAVGTGIDKVLGLATGQRSKVLPSLKAQAKGGVQGWKLGLEDALKGIDTTGLKTQFDIKPIRTFRSGPLAKLETAMNIELRATDRAFYQAAYDGSLGNQLRATKATTPTDAMKEIAHHDALYRTFQDDNRLSALFSGLKRLLNDPMYFMGMTDRKKPYGFGVGDFIIKYPKTPANLLARGLDYSPAGFIKVLMEASKPLMGKPFNQRAFVEALSRATVGTAGLVGTGAFLHKLGIISGEYTKDTDARNLENQVGLGEHKINVSALKRFVLGGFNPEEAKLRPGDTLVSYDWFQPPAISLALGADLDKNQGKNQGAAGTLLSALGRNIIPALTTGINSFADQPVMQGIEQLFGTGEVSRGVANVLQGVPASFIPTLLNQIKQIADNQKRVTYSPDWFEELEAKAKARIPGVEKTLPPMFETLGKPKETYQAGSNSFFNVLLNPAFVTKYKPSPEAKIALDIYRNSGSTTQLPRTAPKYITVDGQRFDFTPKEYSDFQRIIGEETRKGFSSLTTSYPVSQMSENERDNLVKEMVKVLDAAAKAGKEKVLEGRKVEYYTKSGNLKIQK